MAKRRHHDFAVDCVRENGWPATMGYAHHLDVFVDALFTDLSARRIPDVFDSVG